MTEFVANLYLANEAVKVAFHADRTAVIYFDEPFESDPGSLYVRVYPGCHKGLHWDCCRNG